MDKQYTQAPLPFVGQKRYFLNEFKQALSQIPNDGDGWTIVDVFGGSGLLAHTAKRAKPAARVIYNDFDGYAERLGHIPDTNLLLRRLSLELANYPKDKRLDPDTKARVLDTIDRFDGYKDLRCLCSWLLFSSNQAGTLDNFRRKHFYNCLRATPYPTADGYLDGLVVVSEPFDSLIPKHKDPQTLLILDPPYVSTNQVAYGKPHYFGMVQFLRLMQLVRLPFIFFSSTRSELMEYLDFIRQHRPDEWAVFEGAERISRTAGISKGNRYEDNMLVKI